MSDRPLKELRDLALRLRDLHHRTAETPLFNPVFQLGLDLSRRIEGGALDFDALEALVEEIEDNSLLARAERLRALLQPRASQDRQTAQDAIEVGDDFEQFRAHWQQPKLHAVFTAHPTFLLTKAQSEALAQALECGENAGAEAIIRARKRDEAEGAEPITLADEHRCAMRAIANAQGARDRLHADLLREAQRKWPDHWLDFSPLVFRFASWVGYDMDGRTDIRWYDSIRFRLEEKRERLDGYLASLEAIDRDHDLVARLRAARDFTAARIEDFHQDLSAPQALSEAANRLAADHPDKLVSLKPLIARLESDARRLALEKGDAQALEAAIALKTLAAAMRADGLGMGWIHFRVNSSQLHNAIRRRMERGETLDLASKSALASLRRMIARVKPLRSNFAALAIESSTAIRQFIAMAQILGHIDRDTPIRMLIAECEQPATVLAALYFARLFGVEDRVDVSPLFETESALEHGGRFLDALLAEAEFQRYARARGRVCIQTGFSDAGRFVGQIPASLAIERLQGRLAQAMETNGLSDCAALIFNTHGESMGRGAHPASLDDRLAWPLSAWARARFAQAGIAIEPEVSFQGGDGYLFFASAPLAQTTLSRIAGIAQRQQEEAQRAAETGTEDPFYSRTDLSLDFYRAVRSHQRGYLESRIYARAITAFGLGLLNRTGSRVSRRQSDLAADREMSLRQIRAIPHNAVLQQLGYPVNVIAGVGSASQGAYEEIAGLLSESERGRAIVRLVRAANALASIKTVAAYGELFNSAYWASRPYRGTESHLTAPCETLAEMLTHDDRAGVFRRLASQLRVDALKLHRLLALIPPEIGADQYAIRDREERRRAIGAAQALRLALLQHMFLRAVSIPAFSRANDISREDVLEMVLSLRIEEALEQLRRAYPTDYPKLSDFAIHAPSDYPDRRDEGYAQIRRDYIDPIERAYGLCLRLSRAIANHFGAHG